MVKFSPLDGSAYIDSMLSFLSSHIDVLIMHNGTGYDFPLLRKLYGYEYPGKKVDTLLMSRLQRPDRSAPLSCPNKFAPHSVEAWGYRFKLKKPEHEDWSQFSEEMLHRCTQDVEIQHRIYLALLEEGKGQRWRDAHMLTRELFELLHNSEQYGWYVDRPHMDKCLHYLDRWMGMVDRAVGPYLPVIVDVEETLKQGVYTHVAKPFRKNGTLSENTSKWLDRVSETVLPEYIAGPFSRVAFRCTDLNSNHETKKFLLAQGWEPKEWNYSKTTGERTSPKLSKDDPFEGITAGVGRLVARRVQCRHRKSAVLGWINAIREDGRVGSRVVGLTTTGRARHNVIVNVPRVGSFFGRWMRQCFIAQPGWVLVGVDSDANHARQLAAKMTDDEFLHSVVSGDKSKGTDMHTVNMKKFGSICKTRDQAKIGFYALLLGAMGAKLSQVFQCTKPEGDKARATFIDNLGGLKDVINGLVTEWRTHASKRFNAKYNRLEWHDGWFTGLDGRPIYCEYEKDVLGYSLQSDEAIQMARAYVQFHRWMAKTKYKWGVDWGTVCWYHDEYTIECRPEIARKLGKLMARAIVWAGNYYNIKCPHKGNAQIELNWANIH